MITKNKRAKGGVLYVDYDVKEEYDRRKGLGYTCDNCKAVYCIVRNNNVKTDSNLALTCIKFRVN